MKKLSRYLPLVLLIPVLLAVGCAAGDAIRWNESNPAGFWAGLWHGMISVVTFIISLFSKKVKMYECFNNGGWYDFGFLLGIIIIWGGGSGVTIHKSSQRRDRR